MPRIDAPTVAKHHARQRRSLIDAAREILAETGEQPSMGQVGKRVGLARSSVYQYFPSADELLAAVVADIFPAWTSRIHERVEAAPTPGARIWAYIEANIDLLTSPDNAVARALSRIVSPQVLYAPMKEFHRQLQVPVQQALKDLGEPEPDAMAALIDSLILQALSIGEGEHSVDRTVERQRTLARLRRLLAGYLRLSNSS